MEKRLFGGFHCNNCNRRWMSAFTWINTSQACKNCHQKVMPYSQKPLKKPDGLDKSDVRKEHRQDLCDKCKSLGYSCVLRYYK